MKQIYQFHEFERYSEGFQTADFFFPMYINPFLQYAYSVGIPNTQIKIHTSYESGSSQDTHYNKHDFEKHKPLVERGKENVILIEITAKEETHQLLQDKWETIIQ